MCRLFERGLGHLPSLTHILKSPTPEINPPGPLSSSFYTHERVGKENHHVRQEMDEPGPGDPPRLEHALPQQPGQEAGHQGPDETGRRPVQPMRQAEEDRGEEKRLAFADNLRQRGQQSGPMIDLFGERVDRREEENCRK